MEEAERCVGGGGYGRMDAASAAINDECGVCVCRNRTDNDNDDDKP